MQPPPTATSLYCTLWHRRGHDARRVAEEAARACAFALRVPPEGPPNVQSNALGNSKINCSTRLIARDVKYSIRSESEYIVYCSVLYVQHSEVSAERARNSISLVPIVASHNRTRAYTKPEESFYLEIVFCGNQKFNHRARVAAAGWPAGRADVRARRGAAHRRGQCAQRRRCTQIR